MPLRTSAGPLLFVACALASPAGNAQGLRLMPEVKATVTATDNAYFGSANPGERADLVIDLSPSLRFAGQGPQYRLDGELAVHGLVYARESEPNRLLPSGRVDLGATLWPQWITLDSGLAIEQTAADPYSPQPGVESTANRLTTTRFTITPALKHDFSPTFGVQIRSQQNWTWLSGDTEGAANPFDSHAQDNLVRVERKPTPVGATVELRQQETRYDSGAALSSEAARLIGTWAPDAQVQLGLVAGVERSKFSLTEETDPVYGIRADLAASERTHATLEIEHRYFGTAWDLSASHRSPFIAIDARFVRRATAQTSSTLLGAGTNASGLLDAMLTTRYPDPVARAAVVDELVGRLGLTDELGRPVQLFSDAPQLEQGSDLSVALMGRVTVVTFGVYTRRTTQLQRSGDPLPPIAGYAEANRQVGASIGFNRRLGPLNTLDLQLQWSRIVGLDATAGDRTESWLARLAWLTRLSPRSDLTLGLRYQSFDSTRGTVLSANESAVFVTLGHRF